MGDYDFEKVAESIESIRARLYGEFSKTADLQAQLAAAEEKLAADDNELTEALAKAWADRDKHKQRADALEALVVDFVAGLEKLQREDSLYIMCGPISRAKELLEPKAGEEN